MVREVKSGLRKCLDMVVEDGQGEALLAWWEFLPDVVRACRLLESRATKEVPYFLVFK